MHHRQDFDIVGRDDIDDCVWERPPEVPAAVRRTVNAEDCGGFFNLRDELVDVTVKPLAKFGANGRVALGRVFEVEARFRMEPDTHHKPTIFRTSAMT